MKPKDLKSPATWETRHVLIEDRVWYIPDYYDEWDTFAFPGWSSPQLFGSDKPVMVEYCSGNGAWIASKAVQHPECNWLAVEIQFKRVRKIWAKIKNLQLPNLVALCGEGLVSTQHYFPSDSVSEVFINFPDPWPKTRHAKNRIIQKPFLDEVWRVLKVGCAVNMVTDDPTYSEQVIEEFLSHPGFAPEHPAPYYVTEVPGYGGSYFDSLWREKGKTIRYHRFRKVIA